MNLYNLAYTSHMYSAFTSFGESYKRLLTTIDYQLDLSIQAHRKALIKWLNQWGCRQFSLDCHEKASSEILAWHQEGYMKSMPDKALWELNSYELDSLSAIFDSLANKVASDKLRQGNTISVTIGPTGASKILFALQPDIFVPWDEAIRVGLGFSGTGISYIKYLNRIIEEVNSLKISCQKNGIELNEIARMLGRGEATLPQLVGEYFWVTKTKKCYPPSPDTFQHWAEWGK